MQMSFWMLGLSVVLIGACGRLGYEPTEINARVPRPAPDAGHGASCEDGMRNGSETDVDCGGPDCPLCADDPPCATDGGCPSGCTLEVCATEDAGSSCSDGVQNAKETGLDCGGPDCEPCTDAGSCDENSDCRICDAGMCRAPSCGDGVRNQDETGIDCGGTTCAPCSATCFDEVQGQDETGIDCGGASCGGCSALTTTCVDAVYAGHDYKFCDAMLGWNDARIDCLARGMRLARIDDAEEDAWLKEAAVFGSSNFRRTNMWVAGTDQFAEGEWLWSPDTPFWSGGSSGSSVAGLYTNWATDEPNNLDEDEHCLGVALRTNDPPSWNDSPCFEPLWYVCEDY